MTKRGKVLRDTTSGPGLLMIEGQQYHFSLDGVWASEATPKPGQVVDVELDSRGKLNAITVVSESQLAKELAEAATATTGQRASAHLAGIYMPTLAAGGLLAAAWFLLTAVSIQSPFPGRLEFTFWEILGFLNTGNLREMLDGRGMRGAGLYGWLALIALAGPLLPHFWKDKRALLGGILPLVFMAIVGIVVHAALDNTIGGSSDGATAEASKHAREAAFKAISLGLGTYLSIIASLYFALMSAKSFLITKARSTERFESPQQKAA
jgi:hypothetical protein